MTYQDFKIILKIALIFTIISACKRTDEPDLKLGNPVFYIKANIDGLGEITKEAGNDEYYMFATHFQNANDREVYKATLKKTGCDTCKDFFEIEFYSTTLGNNPNIDSTIMLGDYQYIGTKPQPAYKVNFINESDGLNGANYNWDLPNSMTSNKKNPEIILNNPTSFSVGLMATSANGNCNDNITKKIIVGDNSPGCFSQIYYTRYTIDSMTFFAMNSDPTKHFSWDFDDGTIDTSSKAIITKKYNSANTYNVKLTTSDGSTCSATTIFKVSTFPRNSQCICNFRYEVEEVPATIFAPSVKIHYTDKTGKRYSSDLGNQVSNASFKILKIEDFERNEKGEKVKKIDIQFTTRLYFSSTDFIDISSEKSVIGISF